VKEEGGYLFFFKKKKTSQVVKWKGTVHLKGDEEYGSWKDTAPK